MKSRTSQVRILYLPQVHGKVGWYVYHQANGNPNHRESGGSKVAPRQEVAIPQRSLATVDVESTEWCSWYKQSVSDDIHEESMGRAKTAADRKTLMRALCPRGETARRERRSQPLSNAEWSQEHRLYNNSYCNLFSYFGHIAAAMFFIMFYVNSIF